MARGRKPCTYFRNWLFAVEGSPTMHTLMSPRSLMPSAVCLWTPPRSIRSTPRFTWQHRTAPHPHNREHSPPKSVGSVDLGSVDIFVVDLVDSGDSSIRWIHVRRIRIRSIRPIQVRFVFRSVRQLERIFGDLVRRRGSIWRLGFISAVRSVPRFWLSGAAVPLVRRLIRYIGSPIWSVQRFGGTTIYVSVWRFVGSRRFSGSSAPSVRSGF